MCMSTIQRERIFVCSWQQHSSEHAAILCCMYRMTQKRERLKNPTKIEEIQEKKLLTETEPLQLAF